MNEELTLYDAIRKLDPSTKKFLLKEIRAALNLNEKTFSLEETQNDIDSIESGLEDIELTSFLMFHYERENIFTKLYLLVIKLFSSYSSQEELYKSYLLKKLEHKVNLVFKKKIVNYEKGILLDYFGNILYDFYLTMLELNKSFSLLRGNKMALEEALFELIEDEIPNYKHSLYDFISRDDFKEYISSGKKNVNFWREKVDDSIREYLNKIPEQCFENVGERFEFVHLINSIIDFEFSKLLKFFNINVSYLSNSNEINTAQECSIKLISKQLFYFFSLLNKCEKVSIDNKLLNKIIRNYLFKSKLYSSQDESELKSEFESRTQSIFNHILAKFKSFSQRAKAFPYRDLFKLCTKNPIAEVTSSNLKFNVKNFYVNALKLKLNATISNEIKNVEETLFNEKLYKIFNKTISLDTNFLFENTEYINEIRLKTLIIIDLFFQNNYPKIGFIFKILNRSILVNIYDLLNVFLDLDESISKIRGNAIEIKNDILEKNKEYSSLLRNNKIDSNYSYKLKEEFSYISVNILEIKNKLNYELKNLSDAYELILKTNKPALSAALNFNYTIENYGKKTLSVFIREILLDINNLIFILEHIE